MGGLLQFDRVADRYDESRGGPERGVQAAADMAPHLVPGPVFEVGVGTGLVAAALRDRGRHVFGADLSAAMLARAAARIPGRIVRADAQALPLPAGRMSNVVFCHVLHLVSDMPAVIAEAARVLRPGGRLVAVHGAAEHLDADDDLIETTAPLLLLRDAERPDTPPAVLAAAAPAGLRVSVQTWATPRTAQASPNELADTIATKLWSYLWPLDARTWQDTVAPVIAALRALPDPDRPRRQTARMRLTVLAK